MSDFSFLRRRHPIVAPNVFSVEYALFALEMSAAVPPNAHLVTDTTELPIEARQAMSAAHFGTPYFGVIGQPGPSAEVVVLTTTPQIIKQHTVLIGRNGDVRVLREKRICLTCGEDDRR
jgi:hypothetical protein